jgi:tetratricopeptide (TPR) repeat protein
MKIIWMASVSLAIAVTASGQQPPDNSLRPAQQSQNTESVGSPREQALTHAALDMIHKDYAQAVDIYKTLIRQEPNDASLWNRLGIAYHQQSMLGDALKCYEKATKLDKKSGDGWNNIGTVYYQEQKWSKAVRAYRKAIALNQQEATFYSNIGLAYLNNKKVPEALQSFNTALKLDPDVFSQTSRVGTVLQDRSANDRGMFYFLLAKSFATANNAERCAYYLRKAVDEGYAGIATVANDPGFAGVITDPGVRVVLGLPALPAAAPRSRGI